MRWNKGWGPLAIAGWLAGCGRGDGGGAVSLDGSTPATGDAADARPAGGDAAPPSSDCPTANGGVTLDVAADLAAVHGRVTIRGQAPPAAPEGHLWLLEQTRRDFVHLARTSEPSYSAQVRKGTYDLIYSGTTSTVVPSNGETVLRRGLVIDGPITLDVDLAGVRVRGRITLGGAPLSEPVFLIDLVSDGSHTLLGAAPGTGSYDVLLLPGTYDVVAAAVAPGIDVRGLVRRVELGADTTLDIDLPQTRVELAVTLNGQPPPSDVGVKLVRAGTEGIAATPSGIVRVSPGSYDVTVAGKGFRVVAATGVAVSGPSMRLALDAKVTLHEVSGLITVNGLAPVGSTSSYGPALWASGPAGEAILGTVATGSYRVRLAAGTYSLAYLSDAPQPIANRLAHLGELTVAGPMARDIDIRTAVTDVGLTIGGDRQWPAFWAEARLVFSGAQSALLQTLSPAEPVTVIPADFGEVGVVNLANGDLSTATVPGVFALGKGRVEIALPAVPVDVRFTAQGQPPPASDLRHVRLRARDGAVDIDLGSLSSGGRPDAVLPPATYDATLGLGITTGAHEGQRWLGCFTVRP